MIDVGKFSLNSLFQSRKKVEAGSYVAAAVVPQEFVESAKNFFAENSFEVKDVISDDSGVSVLKFADYEPETVRCFKMSENVALLIKADNFENVEKSFAPFAESTSFTDNMDAAGFFPGLNMATGVLMETINRIMETTEKGEEVADNIQEALSDYSTFVVDLVRAIPMTAFKLDGRVLEAVVEEAASEEIEEVAKEEVVDGDTVTISAEGTDAEISGQEKPVDETEEVPLAAVEKAEEAVDLKALIAEALAPIVESLQAVTAKTEELSGKFVEQSERIEKTESTFDSALSKMKSTVNVTAAQDKEQEVKKSQQLTFDNVWAFEGFEGRIEHV